MFKVPTVTEVQKSQGNRLFSEIPINDIYFQLRTAFYNGEEMEVPDKFLDSEVVINEAEAVKEQTDIEDHESTFEEQKENNDFAHDDDPQDITDEFDI